MHKKATTRTRRRLRAETTINALRDVANGATFYRAARDHLMNARHLNTVWWTEHDRGLKNTRLDKDLWKALKKRYPRKWLHAIKAERPRADSPRANAAAKPRTR